MTDAATGTIYALVDPRTGEVRYVGQTTKPIKARLAGHLAAPAPLVRAWIEALVVEGQLPVITPIRADVPSADLDQAEKEEITAHSARSDLLNVASNTVGNAKRQKASREEAKRREAEQKATDRAWREASWRQVADQIRDAVGGPISPSDVPIREIPGAVWEMCRAYHEANRRLEENISVNLPLHPGAGVTVEGDSPQAEAKRAALRQLNDVRPGLEHYLHAYCAAFDKVDRGDYRDAAGAYCRGDQAYRDEFRDSEQMARHLSLIPWAARALDPWVTLAKAAGIDKKTPEFVEWVSDDPAVRDAVELYRADFPGWLGMPRQSWDHDVALYILALGAAHIPGFIVPSLLERELLGRLTALARDRQATREMCHLLREIDPRALDAVYGTDELDTADRELGLPPGASASVIRKLYGGDSRDPNDRAAKMLQRHTGQFDAVSIPGYSGWTGPHVPAVRVAAADFSTAGLFPDAEQAAGDELLSDVKATWLPSRWGLEDIEDLDERMRRRAA